ncbi:MAG: hypothetical protein V2A77_00035 [Pseudomonadota bacterium]
MAWETVSKDKQARKRNDGWESVARETGDGEQEEGWVAWGAKNILRPVLEAGGAAVGGFVGGAAATVPTSGIPTPLTVAGAVTGAGLGYSMGKQAADLVEEGLGVKKPERAGQRVRRAAEDVATGATLEMGGQAAGKVVGAGLQYAGRKLGAIGVTGRGAAKRAGETLRRTTSPGSKYVKNLGEAQALEDEIGGGLKFTRGQATGDPQVISAERARLRSPGPQGAEATEQFATGQQAIRGYGERNLGGGKPSAFVRGVSRAQESLVNATAAAQRDVDALVASKSAGLSPVEAGEQLASRASAAKAAARLRAGQLYDAVPNAEIESPRLLEAVKQVSADFDPAVEKATSYPMKLVQGIRAKIVGKAAQGPTLYDAAGKPISRGGGEELRPISFDDLRKLRSTILSELRAAKSGLNPNAQLARRLNMLRDAVEDTIEQAGNLPGEAGKAYREASAFYRDNYVEPFKRGTVAQILSRDATGAARVRNAQVAAKFLQPGGLGQEVAEDFFRAVGDDALAQKAVRDLVDHEALASITDANGKVITSKLSNFVSKYRPALNRYGLLEDYGQLQNAQLRVESALSSERVFNNSAAANVLGAAPEKIVSEAFKGKNMVNPAATVRQLLKTVGNDAAARRGLESAVTDHILRESSSMGVQFGDEPAILNATFKKVLAKYGPALRELYKGQPEKIKAWMKMQKAVETLYRTKSSPLGGGSDTLENALHVAVSSGGQYFSWKFTMIRAIGRIVGKLGDAKANELLNRAIFDPDFAYGLMATANGKIPPTVMQQKIRGLSAITSGMGTQVRRPGPSGESPVWAAPEMQH